MGEGKDRGRLQLLKVTLLEQYYNPYLSLKLPIETDIEGLNGYAEFAYKLIYSAFSLRIALEQRFGECHIHILRVLGQGNEALVLILRETLGVVCGVVRIFGIGTKGKLLVLVGVVDILRIVNGDVVGYVSSEHFISNVFETFIADSLLDGLGGRQYITHVSNI